MTRTSLRAAVLAAALSAGALVAVVQAAPAQAAGCTPPVDAVACENTKTGTAPAVWDVPGAGSPSIQGFSTDISVNVGGTVQFKISTPARSYRLDIYRLGFYAGRGARSIATVTPSAALPQQQPSCVTNGSTGLVDCGNWAVSASWTVPSDVVSGVFFAHLVRTDGTAGASHVPFVVRDDGSRSALLLQTSDTTWQAYNQYGGNSLYVGAPAGRAYKVSYNRPITTRGTAPEDYLFNAEFPMIRFLEANGYDVTYTSGVDTHRRGHLLRNHRAFLSVGHDEYWSGPQRAAVEAARDAGVHLAFFSGNEVFWKTRYEAGAGGVPDRTLVCYKETKAGAKIDPSSQWTGTWRDGRFSPPSDGGRPENALTGTIFMVNGDRTRRDSIRVPAADGKLRFWRGTSVAGLAAGATATMPAGTLGYEWDADLDNGSRPAGAMRLSTATYDLNGDLLLDEGNTYGSGSATHALVLHRAPSGALVFGAGTVQWSWGLDATHDNAGTATSAAMRQATVNLLADMGAQPATLVNGLTRATASSDITRPTSVITAPAAGSTVAPGAPITISGTATDSGGLVGGVEVSTDGGATWHPALGRGSWTASWTPTTSTAVTLKTRAVDDSGNLEVPGSGVTVNGGPSGPPPTCPCTLFGTSVPVSPSDPDTAAVELGVKLRTSAAGSVTGLRFYKGVGNTGTHTGSLWSSSGTRLATATFGSETTTGWQTVSFPTPVTVTAGTTYVASYFAPNGRYAADDGYFASAARTSGPLTALQNGTDGPNGVYRYGGSGFPTSTYLSANYWVDVVFVTSAPGGGGGGGTDTTPPTIVGRSPAAGATGVPTSTAPQVTFSEPVSPTSVVMTLAGPSGSVAGSVSVDPAATTATFTPTSPLAAGATYSASVSGARDAAGNIMTSASWGFTTAAAASQCPCSLWDTTAVPGTLADPDTAPVVVGVRVTTSRAGNITAVRFYKAASNTGTHVVHVWNAGGTLLASATATGESASGWQTVPLAAAVATTAGTSYVVAYSAPVGRYSADEGFFTSSRTSGPLTAPSGGNGVYAYGPSGTFPSSTYAATNYWVDVVFS